MKNLFPLAALIGSAGVLIFFTGIGLGKLFNITRKIQERGFNSPYVEKLSFGGKMFIFFNNPAVFIPFILVILSALMIIIAIIIFIAGVLQKFLV